MHQQFWLKWMMKAALRAGLRGWGSLCSLGPAPVYVGLLVFAMLSLPIPRPLPPLPAPSGHFAFCRSCVRYLPSGAQRAAPGPVHLACCQEGTIPSPRAPCLALAARECLRGSSGSCAEPGQVMLSPIYRWVVEDWRDADHKRLLILGAQLELRRAWDFTALSTALEIGSAWEVTALPPSRPKALPEPALRAGLITTKPRPRGTKLLDANGTFCFSYFLEDFSSSWGEDLSKLTMQ